MTNKAPYDYREQYKVGSDIFALKLKGAPKNVSEYLMLVKPLMCRYHYGKIKSTGNERLDQHLQARSNLLPIKETEPNETWIWMNENSVALNHILHHERDDLFEEMASRAFCKSYLLRQTFDGQIIERPQLLFLRVASAFHYPNLEKVVACYNEMSNLEYMPASPTLFNAGLTLSQMSSCFLIRLDDNIQSILWSTNAQGLISKANGAVGISYSSLRSQTKIGHQGVATGVIQPEHISDLTTNYVNQGGHREGASQNQLAVWHLDIVQHIRLNDREDPVNMLKRAKTSVGTYDLFWKRVQNDENWSLFSPDQVRGIDRVYGDEFEQLYLEAERDGKAQGQIKARELLDIIAVSLIKTGLPYVINIDAINRKTNMSNIGFISTLNLCQEIALPADEIRIPACNLSAICLKDCIKDGEFDFVRLARVVRSQVENLNAVIERNYYPLPEIEFANKESKPIGIGMMGLSDLFQRLNILFDSNEASELVEKISACVYYNAIYQSSEIAKTQGSYSAFEGSNFSKGIFQFDHWNVQPLEPTQWGQNGSWDALRQKVKRDGIRNSQLTTQQPTSSISAIAMNSEMTEPFYSNIYTKRSQNGDCLLFNFELQKDLEALGLWSEEMFNWIFHQNGSVKGISEVFGDEKLEFIEKKYRTIHEYSQRVIIDHCALRAPYIDGSQSMNLNLIEPSVKSVSNALAYAQSKGLKTLCYYLRSVKHTNAIKIIPKTRPVIQQCSRDNPECLSCQ